MLTLDQCEVEGYQFLLFWANGNWSARFWPVGVYEDAEPVAHAVSTDPYEAFGEALRKLKAVPEAAEEKTDG